MRDNTTQQRTCGDHVAGVRRDHAKGEHAVLAEEVVHEPLDRLLIGDHVGRFEVLAYEFHTLQSP